MKKLFVVLAATLICSTCFLTSCKKDKKNDDTPTPVNDNVYEVNLTAIVHECSTPYLMINLEYTDADGVNHTEVVKGTDQTETILPKALEYYQSEIEPYCTSPEEEELLSHYTVRNFTMTVPAGKSFSFTSTCAAVPGYTAPTEEFSMIHPMVLVTAKLVSGDSEDLSQNVQNDEVYIKINIGSDPIVFETAMSLHVNTTCGNGHYTF